MSWDVTLKNLETGEAVRVDSHEEGGTYALGGSNQAELNVTYNYGKVLREVWDGETLTLLDGKVAGKMVSMLEKSVSLLGTERSADYWEASEGNVGYALNVLLQWAKANPDAVFEVT